EEDAAQVDALDALPRVEGGVEHGGVVVGGDAGVVEQDVDPAEALADLAVEVGDELLAGQVDLQRHVAGAVVQDVDARDLRALALEELDGGGADPAARARHDANASLESAGSSHHPSVA